MDNFIRQMIYTKDAQAFDKYKKVMRKLDSYDDVMQFRDDNHAYMNANDFLLYLFCTNLFSLKCNVKDIRRLIPSNKVDILKSVITDLTNRKLKVRWYKVQRSLLRASQYDVEFDKHQQCHYPFGYHN